MNITEDYCSYEVAKLLKEKGIDVNTADMYHHYDEDFGQFDLPQIIDDGEGSFNTHHILFPKDIPAWSLSALLDMLDYPQLSKDKLSSGKTGWMVSIYPNDCRYDSCWHDNPIDACYEMVIKLHEQKLL